MTTDTKKGPPKRGRTRGGPEVKKMIDKPMLDDLSPKNNAFEFAEAGFAVLPLHGVDARGRCGCGKAGCPHPGKHPHAALVRHGLKDASVDLDEIEAWFDRFADLNYGIVTDELHVIDLDPRNGGTESWRKLIRKHADIHSWRVQTGGGGQHVFCRAPQKPLGCGKLAPGIDFKGVGGYVVGVGSLHEFGRRYRWFADCSAYELELEPLPKWIIDELEKKTPADVIGQQVQRAPAFYSELVAPASEGVRNECMTKLVGHLFGSLHPDRAVLFELVRCWNLIHCSPPLDDEEVFRIAGSIARREDDKRRGRA